MATEAGFHTSPLETNGSHPPTDEPTAAVYTLRTVLEHFADGIDRTYLYELLDQRAAPLDSYSNFGLLHADFSPKPAFTQLRRLLSMIGSSAPPSLTPLAVSIGGDTSDVRSLLLQQGAGRYALVLWRTASVWDRDARRPLAVAPRRVTVSAPQAATVAVEHPAAGTTEPAMTLRAGTLPLELAANPVVLLLRTHRRRRGRPGRPGRLRRAGRSVRAGGHAPVAHPCPPHGRTLVGRRSGSRRARGCAGRCTGRRHRVRRATTRALRPGRHRVGLGRLRAGRYRLRLAVAGRARPVVAGAVRFRVR